LVEISQLFFQQLYGSFVVLVYLELFITAFEFRLEVDNLLS
jgi:hypothetical protein